MYCRECDREDVGSWHKCFVRFGNQINPLKKRPKKNTRLARKMAELYEKFAHDFPSGITNSKIERLSREGEESGWKWCLRTINGEQLSPNMGSQSPATQCAKEFSKVVSLYNGWDHDLIIE